MIRTVFVKAPFKSISKDELEDEPTGEFKSNWLGQKKEIITKKIVHKKIGWSDCEIDGEELSNEINQTIEKFSDENYKLLSLVPITSGRYNYEFSSQGITSSTRILSQTEKVSGGGSYGYGYGYSFTEGMLLTFEKK